MTIGERIRAARKKAGLTQAQLAEKSGVATISIHQYETGKRQPRIEQLEAIAQALALYLTELIEPDVVQILIKTDEQQGEQGERDELAYKAGYNAAAVMTQNPYVRSLDTGRRVPESEILSELKEVLSDDMDDYFLARFARLLSNCDPAEWHLIADAAKILSDSDKEAARGRNNETQETP